MATDVLSLSYPLVRGWECPHVQGTELLLLLMLLLLQLDNSRSTEGAQDLLEGAQDLPRSAPDLLEGTLAAFV